MLQLTFSGQSLSEIRDKIREFIYEKPIAPLLTDGEVEESYAPPIPLPKRRPGRPKKTLAEHLTVPEITLEVLRKKLRAVMERRGTSIALECVKKFQVAKISDLTKDNFQKFMDHCDQVLKSDSGAV